MIDKYILLSTLAQIKRNINKALDPKVDPSLGGLISQVVNAFSDTLESEILEGKYDIKDNRDA